MWCETVKIAQVDDVQISFDSHRARGKARQVNFSECKKKSEMAAADGFRRGKASADGRSIVNDGNAGLIDSADKLTKK